MKEMDEAKALLQSKKTEDRARAVRLLRRVEVTPETQRLLLVALKDHVSFVATQAAEALGELADDSAAVEMTDRFLYLSEDGPKRDPGCHIRSNLAFAFGRLTYYLAERALRIGIRARQIEAVGGVPFDTAAHLRANCALALAQLRSREALRDISLLLFDMGTNVYGSRLDIRPPTVEPRKAAAQALVRLGDPNGLVPLALKLTYPGDEDVEVLQECMQAVVELEDERGPELLCPYLKHHDRHLAAFAAVMLAQTRAPEATTLLQETIPYFTGDPLRAVILALTAMRTDEADALLRALAADISPEVRRIIAEVAPDYRVQKTQQ
jgi:HEAT repeat protein